jgi:hypothetical protein
MSLRQDIVTEIIRVLKEIEEPRPVLVTAQPFEVDKLAITQFPALLVKFTNENRETVSMGAPGAGRRTGEITCEIRAFVRGSDVEIDTKRNTLLEALEEQLEFDRYLGLQSSGVLDSQITTIEVIDRQAPLAEMRIELTVNYTYLRGTT